MKKNLLLFTLTLAILSSSFLNAQSPGITAFTTGLCINSSAYASVTTTVATATSYSWSVNSGSCVGTQTPSTNGLGILVTYPCCGTYTLSCTAYNGGTPLTTNTIAVNVSCNPAPSMSITSTASNGTACSGTSNTLTGLGATTYSWIPSSVMGANLIVAPTSNLCYTLLGTNSLGCFNMGPSSCISVVPAVTIGISSNTAVCMGSSTTLTFTGAPSFILLPNNINSPNPIISPTTSMLYTVCAPSQTFVCPTYSVFPILVLPVPTVNVMNPGTSTLCLGETRTLVAIGANTYSWSNGPTTASIIVTPLANTCYTAWGQNMQMCTSMVVYCFSVFPLPNLVISGSSSVCLGSSITLTVSGANTYTWSPFSNASTLNILPTSNGTSSYTVSGTDAFGCINTFTFPINTWSTCADVWPGDANSDGIVNSTDVLELGLQFSATGAARTPGGNAYTAQYATAWAGTISTGKNKSHADCNGDGVVSNADTVAIVANFAMTHSFKPGAPGSTADITLKADNGIVYPGQYNKVNVILGSAGSNINQLYGLSFELNIDPTYVETNSAYLVYTSSFLNATNQNIEFRKAQLNATKFYAASVRTDQSNVSGNGKIAELWFKVKANAPNQSTVGITVGNAEKIDNSGIFTNLTGGTDVVLVSTNLVGLGEANQLQQNIRVFPNPAKDKLILQNGEAVNTTYALIDLLGQIVLTGSFEGKSTIDLSAVANGTYIIKLESVNGTSFKKLLVDK